MTETKQQTNRIMIHSHHRCHSLTYAVQAIARDAGIEIDFDDLSAAMGLPFMLTAVPDDPDLSNWMLYARDAFLIPACRLFGLTIRELHPPEAARGLRNVAEFAQHFDASYRPLIHRAIENNQPILAWQGWAGDASMLWGVITAKEIKGAGFSGQVYKAPDEPHPQILEKPPVQVYVVESTKNMGEACTSELNQLANRHAITILNNGLRESHGVLTGTAAMTEWKDRMTC